jgi:hypothetical protein
MNVSNFLDVELLEQSIQCDGNKTIIHWSTATETNNRGFEIAKSSDGIHFQIIGFVYGAGNSNTIKNYQFTDPSTDSKMAYYKLTQEDYDNSRVVLFTKANECYSEETSVSIEPNPFSSTCTLNFTNTPTEPISIYVYSSESKLVFEKQLTPILNKTDIDMSSLPTGVYYVKIIHPRKVNTIKIIKQ